MIKIRLLTRKDIKAAAAIAAANWSKKWSGPAERETKEMFGKSEIRPTYYVAEEDGEIVGFTGYMMSWMDYNIYQIFWVNVLPKRQKQGIGKMLIQKVIREVKKKKSVHLLLLTSSNKTLQYYEKLFGFKVLQKFMGQDYNLMSLDLKNEKNKNEH